MIYISQSDLNTFQLIFKDDNSTNNAWNIVLKKISGYNLLCNFDFKKSWYATAQLLLFLSIIFVHLV